jgi:hypothetical protein
MVTVIRSRFYVVASLIVAAIAVIGFSRSYFLRPLFERPPLTGVMHLHALVFTAWVALFIVQARLVMSHRIALHQKLGIAGGVLALSMVVLTFAAMIESSQRGATIGGIPAWKFAAFSTVSILTFAGFVIAALAIRRRPDWHARFMMLATIGVLGPAVGRLLIMTLGVPAARHANLLMVAFAVACLAYDWLRNRRVHPAYVIGASVYVLVIPLKRMLADSQVWAGLARWMLG